MTKRGPYRQISVRRNGDTIQVTTETVAGDRQEFKPDSVYLDGFKVNLLGSGGFVLRGGFDGHDPFEATVVTDELHGSEAVFIDRQ